MAGLMTGAARESRVARYYDWLSRYHSLVARLGHKGGFDPLTVHRLLRSDRAEVAPADVAHDRLLTTLGPIAAPRVIDAGSGFGGTVFYMCARLDGQYDGLTLSPVQQARAAREAARRGVAGSCRFHVRSYDADLTDVVPGGADLVVAIESLAHSADPLRSVVHLSRALRPGGTLAIIDDVPRDTLGDDDPDFAAFRGGWSCPAIARDRTLAAAFAAAHLSVEHDEDLTPLVPLRDRAALERLVLSNRRWRRVLGGSVLGSLVDSLHGGLMLDRLYRRGLMRYRFVLARLARPGSMRPSTPS